MIFVRVISFILTFMILFLMVSKTPSDDNLGDAIQFLQEFDREAAEMCNRWFEKSKFKNIRRVLIKKI